MIKILFMDDDEIRHEAITQMFVGHNDDFEMTKVKRADQAIKELEANEFDIIMLDHDLGGNINVSSAVRNCGYTVACHLEELRESYSNAVVNQSKNMRAYVIAHTMNVAGGINMMRALRKYRAVFIPFSPEELLEASLLYKEDRS